MLFANDEIRTYEASVVTLAGPTATISGLGIEQPSFDSNGKEKTMQQVALALGTSSESKVSGRPSSEEDQRRERSTAPLLELDGTHRFMDGKRMDGLIDPKW